jgi:type I restriction enzyme R subunit
MQSYHAAAMRIFHGIDRTQLDNLVRILEPENKRAEFEMAYKRFATSIERILPQQVQVNYLNDLRWLAYIRIAAKARYEADSKIDVSDCGEKVHKLISEYIESSGIQQWIEPVTLFDKDFKEKLGKLGSSEAVASAMEHAARRAITARFDDNPVFYTDLMEKLKLILEETRANWDEMRHRLGQLHEEIITGEESEADQLGIDPKEYALYRSIKGKLEQSSTAEKVITDAASTHTGGIAAESQAEYLANPVQAQAKEIALEVEHTIRKAYTIDWVTNPTKTADIERALLQMLTSKYHRLLPYAERKNLVAELMALAKKHYFNI